MKKILIIALLYPSLYALQTSDRLFECTKIFKERKSELLVELERIDEQKQALASLKTATEALLKQKKAKLEQQEESVNKKLNLIKKKEQNIKESVAKNQALLKEIKSTKMSKIAQTFAKMKPASAANILADMNQTKATAILQSLQPKVVGKIFSKMDAKKASQLTQLLLQ